MKKLDKSDNTIDIDFRANEGERTLLSSNESGVRSPSLDFLDTSDATVTEDMILRYLAKIIADMYLSSLCPPNHKNKP